MKMKVTEKPPEIKDEPDESDPLNSLLNKLDEDEYQGQVRIDERRLRIKTGWNSLDQDVRWFLLSRLYGAVVIHFRPQIDDGST